MFVVHTIYENEGNTTRDYGHVNQFLDAIQNSELKKTNEFLKNVQSKVSFTSSTGCKEIKLEPRTTGL